MATTLKAGNATNGAVIVGDNTGILELKTGTGSGTTALTLSTAQAATFAGAVTSSGLITGATGALYPIVRATAITLTNQTAPAFTDIPPWAKRVTLMLRGVSTNSTGTPLIQLGTGSTTYTTSGYLGSASSMDAAVASTNYTTGFGTRVATAATVFHGNIIITNVTDNAWVASGNIGFSNTAASAIIAGSVSLGDTLTAVRLFIDGTQFFDAGTINLLWE